MLHQTFSPIKTKEYARLWGHRQWPKEHPPVPQWLKVKFVFFGLNWIEKSSQDSRDSPRFRMMDQTVPTFITKFTIRYTTKSNIDQRPLWSELWRYPLFHGQGTTAHRAWDNAHVSRTHVKGCFRKAYPLHTPRERPTTESKPPFPSCIRRFLEQRFRLH